MLQFELLHPRVTEEMLGYLPSFLSEHNQESASKQFDANYRHGGGWQPMSGWRMRTAGSFILIYPGDPPIIPIARVQLRDETIYVYPHAFVAIFQKDGSFEVARMD